MPRRFNKLIDFLHARLSPEGYLGLHLTIGLFLLIFATWIFVSIAEDVYEPGHAIGIDQEFSNWLHAHTRPWLTVVMLIVTHLHSGIGITVITAALLIYLLRQRERYWLMTFIVTVFGGMLLNLLLKNTFQRPRPSLENPILTLSSYGFPSGHTMTAACLYGVLGAYAISRTTSWLTRIAVALAAAFMVLLVGFSRIYLGAHYLSDVLAAMAEGLAWLAFCITAVETLKLRRVHHVSGSVKLPKNAE